MTVREMRRPEWEVKSHEHAKDDILLRFAVPHSRFGPVCIFLTRYEAKRLCFELEAAVRS